MEVWPSGCFGFSAARSTLLLLLLLLLLPGAENIQLCSLGSWSQTCRTGFYRPRQSDMSPTAI
jgi:hypothetical protein